jgi:hypothetical protein
MVTVIPCPQPREYAPFFNTYVARVRDEDVLEVLRRQVADMTGLYGAVPERDAGYRYAPGKWSIREVLGHVCDAERVFGYRALRAARGDTTLLAAFDETAWIRHANFDRRTLADLLAEFRGVREATVVFLASLEEEDLLRRGAATSGEFTVRAMAAIAAGHAAHHAAIVRERYLPRLRAAV